LNLDSDEAALANGTHGGQVTSIESPRGKTSPPAPARQPSRPAVPPRSDAPDKHLGEVLGSYRLIELLGTGGMGYVYRAEHVKLGREVALKLLRGDYASRRDAVSRFFQEARTVNRVRHRNIVDVTDFIELDDGTTYIIMELLTGTSLGAWAKAGVELPRALGVLVQICDGLDAAHQVGVVHRDLKPDNVIVVPGEAGAELVKLLDFGVAKLLNREDEDVGFETAAGSVIGTPAYMSPEQAGGMLVDARSDIYSLGALMYDMFCGQPMFRGRAFGEYVRKHLTETPVPPRQTPGGRSLDPALEAVILRCLDKDPDQRYANILELRETLLGLLGGARRYPAETTASGGLALGTPPPALPARATTATKTATPRPTGSRLPAWIWFLGGAAALGVIVVALWYARRRMRSEPDAPVAAASTMPSTRPARPTAEPIDEVERGVGSAVSIDPAATVPPEPSASASDVAEVRFESEPTGGVFAVGGATELCRTPCSFRIAGSADASDGGAGVRPEFVVRQAGYHDAQVTVDLAGGVRSFHVVLEPAVEPRGAQRPHATRAGKRPAKAAKAAKAIKIKTKTTAAPNIDNAKAPQAPAREPSDETPPPDRKPTPIDPTDTLDPFRPSR
jgi:serine/threonine-protein kinase